MMRASWRGAMLLAAGICLFGGSGFVAVRAADSAEGAAKSTDTAKASRHRHHTAHHRSSRTAQKSDDKPARSEEKVSASASDKSAPASTAMPASVANANAQLAAADGPAAAASALTTRANDNVMQAAADQVSPPKNEPAASATQPSDAERNATRDSQRVQKIALAAADTEPQPAPVVTAANAEGSAWEQSSLIGKIFIGVGALLTLASAARLFMA